MVYWRVYSAARRQAIAVEGLFSGASAFLIGGSPKLTTLDLNLLRLPGIYTMAINSAALVVEPSSFICLDTASCFSSHIYSCLSIQKILPYFQFHHIVAGKRVCEYPNTIFYDSNSKLAEYDFCTPAGPLVDWGNTFFTALHCLYQLGFKTVYLIGCTFEILDKVYAWDQELTEEQLERNKNTYISAIATLKKLMPLLKDDGFNVMTCHPDTPLEGICEFIQFRHAISACVMASTPEFSKPVHTLEADW